jgi:hypothetical protein
MLLTGVGRTDLDSGDRSLMSFFIAFVGQRWHHWQ